MRKVLCCLGVWAAIGLGGTGCAALRLNSDGFERWLTPEIYSVRYEPEKQCATIVTRTGEVWEYQPVAPEQMEEWRRAPDRDEFYRTRVKGQISGRKIEF